MTKLQACGHKHLNEFFPVRPALVFSAETDHLLGDGTAAPSGFFGEIMANGLKDGNRVESGMLVKILVLK